jgi:uncharacterized coiled-coil protein SlyX
MRNRIEPKKGRVRWVPRVEHETEVARLQLEITDLTARLAESRARDLQLSQLPNDAEALRENVARLESQLHRTEMNLNAATNRIKELQKAALRPAREEGIAA